MVYGKKCLFDQVDQKDRNHQKCGRRGLILLIVGVLVIVREGCEGFMVGLKVKILIVNTYCHGMLIKVKVLAHFLKSELGSQNLYIGSF